MVLRHLKSICINTTTQQDSTKPKPAATSRFTANTAIGLSLTSQINEQHTSYCWIMKAKHWRQELKIWLLS